MGRRGTHHHCRHDGRPLAYPRRSAVLTPSRRETLLASVGGAALGAFALRRFGRSASLAGAAIGGANGAIAGARRVYDWSRPAGVAAFFLDSTWAITTTGASVVVQAVHAVLPGGAGFRADLSERQSRFVFERGVHIRRGFATAIGPVITNASGRHGLDSGSPAGARRRRFVRDHEGLHVWQQRWFGPVFPLVYAAWMAGGVVVGTGVWLRNRQERWYSLVETAGYYDNPFEYWAYRNDGHWPPPAAHPLLHWGPSRAGVSRPSS